LETNKKVKENSRYYIKDQRTMFLVNIKKMVNNVTY